MTFEQIRNHDTVLTAGAAAAIQDDATREYVLACLERFYHGDFGKTPREDVAANIAELNAGTGRIIGRYEKAHALKGDIMIIAYFSDDTRESDFNYTTILYTNEY